MKTLFRLMLIVLVLLPGYAYGQQRKKELANILEKKYQVIYHNIKVDEDGKYLVTGFFEDSIRVGNQTFKSRGITDAFFARFDKNLNMEWFKLAGGNHVNLVKLLHTDVNNNIYISGMFKGLVYFEDTIIQSPGSYNYFTAKYNDRGDLIWIRQNQLK